MTRSADISRGIDPGPGYLVLPDARTARMVVERIRSTPRKGDAWMLYSGYEEGWIVEWYPKGRRSGNAVVMPDGTAWDHQLQRTVKTGLPI